MLVEFADFILTKADLIFARFGRAWGVCSDAYGFGMQHSGTSDVWVLGLAYLAQRARWNVSVKRVPGGRATGRALSTSILA